MNSTSTFVIGVGLTKFEKPRARKWDYPEIGKEAAEKALIDANIEYKDIEAVVVSHVYGESTSGQKAVYALGLTGIPIFNTNNNCSSASCALMLSRLLVQSKHYKCVLALGFEKMDGGLTVKWDNRLHPSQQHFDRMEELGVPAGLVAPTISKFTSDVLKIYAYGAREHIKRYGTTQKQIAKIAYKNHFHGQYNPNASMQHKIPIEKILSREICHPLTLAMCALTGDGGAAAVICNQEFIKSKEITKLPIEIIAQQMVTDLPSSFNGDLLSVGGYDMAEKAAADCFTTSGYNINDVDVIELHDCFAANELFLYEALGLCEKGKGGELIDSSKWIKNENGGQLCQLGNRWVVNPDGGLESKGHPIGATGLAQCAEIVTQLRGVAGKRQVPKAKIGLQHNFGIGGAAVVTMYRAPVTSKL